MNSKVNKFIKNFSYTLSSNIISFVISTLVVLIIPKVIGLEAYSYWQLYIFYSSYIGFLHFGWNDGVYLRYGGDEYDSLNKSVFFSQFIMLGILQGAILVLVFVLAPSQSDRNFILKATAICMLIVNLRGFLIYVLQATNKIKEYARVTIFDRLLYILFILIFLFSGGDSYKLIMLFDLLSKCISLLFAIFICKDMILLPIRNFKLNFSETFANISVGVKLMISNVSSMLIIGIVRFGIERSWGVTTFGKVSLTLSVSNLLMLFINALGVIMFPVLRRIEKDKLAGIYKRIRDLLMVVMFGMLIFYYPVRVLLSYWLTEYTESLKYMALLFPLSIYEGKMALLVNTYLKTLRKERRMLQVNMISMSLSLLTTVFTTLLIRRLDLAVLSIVLLLMFRAVVSEVVLSRILGISLLGDIALEITLSLAFIVTGWFGASFITPVIYLICYIVYLVIKKKDLIETKSFYKALIKLRELS